MDDSIAPRAARLRVRLGALVVLVLVGLGCAVLVAALGDHGSVASVGRQDQAASAGPLDQLSGATIFVHILGAVERPGLYSLREGDRAIDAVAAAGGFTDAADRAQLNLARFVVDGEQIYVPSVGEIPTAPPGLNAQGKVNINTADAATLETLPRVGPAMAARIIDWRNANGRFASIDDLMSVTGIGEKTFDG
ncbi:MAG: ComEA family DNA-binding protein, partial [Rhodoglobus sp.]